MLRELIKPLRWCSECQQYGHRKWLFLGTHRTHRLYFHYKIWSLKRRIEKQKRQYSD